MKCLVVEDNLLDQKMIKRTLYCARIEIDVSFASTLGAARKAVSEQKFSLILCDNNLPDGNGADFVQELANDPVYRDTPIVIISGWPSPFMWAKARAAGVQIIDKNDQPQIKLLEIFRRRLDGSRQSGSARYIH